VRQRALPSFRAERAAFSLRFTCEHCTYFHVEREQCMHGYPNAEHREGQQGEADELVFCKEFELM
jgi:hypothetical protein